MEELFGTLSLWCSDDFLAEDLEWLASEFKSLGWNQLDKRVMAFTGVFDGSCLESKIYNSAGSVILERIGARMLDECWYVCQIGNAVTFHGRASFDPPDDL